METNIQIDLAKVISAAAESDLGILALLSVALSVLAYVFFAKAAEKIKVGIFVLLFLGVVGFGAAIFKEASKTKLSEQAPQSAQGTSTVAVQPAVIAPPKLIATQPKEPEKKAKEQSSLQPSVIFSPAVYIGMPKEKIPGALGASPDWKLIEPNSSQIYLTKNIQFAGVTGVASFYVENDKLVVARLIYSSDSGSKSWEPHFDKYKAKDETFGFSAETHQKQCAIFRESFLGTLLASYSTPASTKTPRDISAEVENWNKGSQVEIRQASQVTTKYTFDRTSTFSDLSLENTIENIDYVEHRTMSGVEIGTNSFRKDTCQTVLAAYLKGKPSVTVTY